jgi:hypothetical protein
MYFWLTSALADFRTAIRLKNDQIIRSFRVFNRREHLAPVIFPTPGRDLPDHLTVFMFRALLYAGVTRVSPRNVPCRVAVCRFE